MPDERDRRWTVALAALGALVVAVAVVAAIVAVGDDDGDDVASVSSTTTVATTSTSEPATTTTAPATTAPTTAAPTTSAPTGSAAIEASAVWPVVGSDVRYDDPREAARGFAEDLVGFTDPVVGDFLAGDARSGEVEVRPREDGPVTTVLVRQLGDDGTWWVLGSQTAEIQLDEPAAGATIEHPLALSGQALAFEGTVEVQVRGDGVDEPLGEGFVTGSGGPDLGPFEGEVGWTNPGGGWGALVLSTMGGEEPIVWQATVVRVRFADGT